MTVEMLRELLYYVDQNMTIGELRVLLNKADIYTSLMPPMGLWRVIKDIEKECQNGR